MSLSFSAFVSFFLLFSSCQNRNVGNIDELKDSSSYVNTFAPDTTAVARSSNPHTETKISPQKLVSFAKTLIGVPYKYGATSPEEGFDCSGFITYVFHHFDRKVPRSSVDFTNYGKEVGFSEAKPGDLILFTGTDSTRRVVGHMGILTQTQDTLKFIHSTSGKAYGITITPLNDYYRGRFVKLTRVLE